MNAIQQKLYWDLYQCAINTLLPEVFFVIVQVDQQYVCFNEGEFGYVTVPLNIRVAGLP